MGSITAYARQYIEPRINTVRHKNICDKRPIDIQDKLCHIIRACFRNLRLSTLMY